MLDVTRDGQEQIAQYVLREVRVSMVTAKIGRLNAFASADTKELLATFQHVKLDATKQGYTYLIFKIMYWNNHNDRLFNFKISKFLLILYHNQGFLQAS